MSGDYVRIQALIFYRTKAQVPANTFAVGQVALFFLSCFNCDVPVTVLGHSEECSKQFPRGKHLCRIIVRAEYYLPLNFTLEADSMSRSIL